MHKDISGKSNKLLVAIHSTKDSFGFALREGGNHLSDQFFIKKFDKDLCNNLIVDFSKFIKKENFKNIEKISVSLGPSNFNASRLTVVLARTLSQQINCPLESFSSFELMAKRIAMKNNCNIDKQTFWIFTKLKKRGYIAGKYEVNNSEKIQGNFFIDETIIPQLFDNIKTKEPAFQAEYDDIEDLRELLKLSTKKTNPKSWEKVIPIYPLSPIN